MSHNSNNSYIQAKRRASVVAKNYLGEKPSHVQRASPLVVDSMASENLGKDAQLNVAWLQLFGDARISSRGF